MTSLLSTTSKLGNIKSFSLRAGQTCNQGTQGEICKGCYAFKGNYTRFKAVNAKRDKNLKASLKDGFTYRIIDELENSRFFRWFDSGDIPSVSFLRKLLFICKNTPWVTHWIPTQSYDSTNATFIMLLNELKALNNVTLRASSKVIDSLCELSKQENNNTFVISKKSTTKINKNVFICPSYKNKGKCGSCKACFDKTVETIAYLEH